MDCTKQQEVGFRPCPNQCSHNGVCFGGECMCEAGYSGVDCAIVEVGNDSCQNDCGAFGGTKNARGRCWLGKCFCYPGFQGSDCTEVLKLPCPTDDDLGVCSGRGECHYGTIFFFLCVFKWGQYYFCRDEKLFRIRIVLRLRGRYVL